MTDRPAVLHGNLPDGRGFVLAVAADTTCAAVSVDGSEVLVAHGGTIRTVARAQTLAAVLAIIETEARRTWGVS